MTPRSMGRRKWMDHWSIRLSVGLGVLLLVTSLTTLFVSIRHLQKPQSPHFHGDKCFTCHSPNKSKMKSEECYKCHDTLTRELLPNAFEDRKKLTNQPCSHPIKTLDEKGEHSITKLCTTCHEKLNAYVSLINIQTQKYVEIDISLTHPVGLMPTETVRPKTLKLEDKTGAINCVTCHDPHGTDRRFHLLRYYHPGNGRPADFRPLCNDCHEDGWMPLRLTSETIIKHEHNGGITH